MSHKRPRRVPWLVLGLGLPLAGAFQPLPVPGPFSLGEERTQQHTTFLENSGNTFRYAQVRCYARTRRSFTALQGSASIVWEETEQAAHDSPQHLPPWLSQYDNVSAAQLTEQIQWLEYNLMEQGFLVADITQIISTLQQMAVRDSVLTAGMVDFLRLLLSLRQDESGAVFVTTPVLLASIIHYADCVAVRRKGMPDSLREALMHKLSSSGDETRARQSPPEPLLLPGMERIDSESSSIVTRIKQHPLGLTPEPNSNNPVDPYERQVRHIVKGAARVKRAECLAHAVLQHRVVTQAQAARLRNLYLMSMEQDWRSLAIRVVACLYRLEGLLRVQSSDYTEKNQQMVQTAREALRIYAPLAQRLGMHRLKAMIEERAFRLQYRRQYRAVSSLYKETGEVMQSVATYLQSHIQQIVASDDALVDQLQNIQVTARVKEPYSFWKKVLNQKARGLLKPASDSDNMDEQDRRSLSVTQVNDIVALRVILQAKKLDPDEPDKVTRAREKMLCYYVQHLIRAQWPETDAGRLKDYIRNPKPNGYQSLHHTSQIASRGTKFPFEVQVRSAQMHAQAEYGPSAHWDYKLQGGCKALPPATSTMALRPQAVELARPARLDSENQPSVSAIAEVSFSKSNKPDGYVDALITAREDMLRNQIYVFIMGDGNEDIERGELISVPANSSIRDAVEEIEYLIPAKVQVWKNGRLATSEEKLENGDVMMIGV